MVNINKEAYTYAVRILAKQDYSTFKMQSKLLEKNFLENEVDDLILKLTQLKFLDDDKYARSKIEQLIVKGYSNQYVLLKLEFESLSSNEQTINSIREEKNLSEAFQLKKLIKIKFKNKPVPSNFEARIKLKRQVASYAASKGYSFEDIQDALENTL